MINEANLIKISNDVVKPGQRVIKIGDRMIPVGVGGVTASNGNSSSSSGGNHDIRLGYLTDDLLFQELDISGAAPEKYGSPSQVEPCIFKTGVGGDPFFGNDGGVDIGGNGTFDVAKVRWYTPAKPERIVSVVISGIGKADPDDESSEDYSELNGKYVIDYTSSYVIDQETIAKTGNNVVYKLENSDIGYLIPTWSEESGAHWEIRHYADDDWSMLYMDGADLHDGVGRWTYTDYGTDVNVNLVTNKTEASEMNLAVYKAKSYTNGEWGFETNSIKAYGFDVEPVEGGIYAMHGTEIPVLIGNPIAYESSYTADEHTQLMLHFDIADNPLKDTSIYDLSVTNSGGSYASGMSGGGWNFDGGYLQAEAPSGSNMFNFGTSSFTFEAWIYPTSDERQCLWAAESDGKFAVCFSYQDRDCRIGVFGTETNGWNNFIMSDPIPLYKWSHVVIERITNILCCYVDFKPTQYRASMYGKQVDMGNKLGIGRWGNDPYDFRNRWKGLMDDIRISNYSRYQIGVTH